jgi:hypothetical protein
MDLGEDNLLIILCKCIELIKKANKCKKSHKLKMTLDMLCIGYKKGVVVKLKFKFL